MEMARKAAEERVAFLEKKLHDLEARVELDGREFSSEAQLRQHLGEELQYEREQHAKDLSERDFAADQTRKKYQGKQMHFSSRFRLLCNRRGIGAIDRR